MPDSTITGAASGATGGESSLSNWAGPYVTNMLGQGQALAQQPYQAYTGPLTAGASPLQQKAFTGIGSLTTPTAMGTAATNAGNIASQMGNLSYSPTQFSNAFTAPQEYQASDIKTATFTPEYAQQYMNPYLQQALDPQIAEARRQAEIQRMGEAGRLANAGAFGGSRQAIMEAEGSRNLLQNLAKITGQGYNTAFQQAGQMFTSDQARALQAAQANEASRQFGAQQGMTAAQQAAQYGLAGQQATEASKQFGANFGLGALRDQLAATRTQSELARAGLQSDMDIARQQAELGGIQRGIESEGIAADMAQFEKERLEPYKNVQFMQSLLQGLPISAQSYSYPQASLIEQIVSGAGGVAKFLELMGGAPASAPAAPAPAPAPATN